MPTETTSRYLTLPNNLRIHLLEAGDPTAPPLLLLHGYPMSAQLWRQVIPPLAASYHVIAPDLPGYGQSDKPDVVYDMNYYNRFLLDFLAALDIDQVQLVAHDLGATMALSFVARHPERVSQFVCMDTAPYAKMPLTMALAIRFMGSRLGGWFMRQRWCFRFMMKWFGFHNGRCVTEDMVNRYRQPWVADRAGRRAIWKLLQVPPQGFYTPRAQLQAITVPTLVLWGEGDWGLPPALGQKLQRDLQNATLETVPEAGHFLQEEQPEAVTRHLLAFLT